MGRLRAALIADLAEHEQVLRAGAGFFAGSESVTRAEFVAFVGKLGLEERDPGVRALALIVPVRRESVPAWLEKRRAEGPVVKKGVTPAGRPELYLIEYAEPSRPGAAVVGWDAGTDPAYRTGIERARDTGQATLAGPLAGPLATSGPLFALQYPLYRTLTVPPAVEARRREFRGALSLMIDVRSFMEVALAGCDPDIEVELFDGPAADPARSLFVPVREPGAPRPPARARRTSASLSIGGKLLTLVFSTLPTFERTQGSVRPFLVLGGGFAMSLLLFGLLWAVTSARGRALGLAEEMTVSLRESEQRNREILFRMADGLLVADRKTLAIVDVNPALERILGYSRAELLERTVFDISGHERGSLLLNASRAAELGALQIGERLFVRKDGATVHLDASLLFVRGRTQELLYAFLRDVTGREMPQEPPRP